MGNPLWEKLKEEEEEDFRDLVIWQTSEVTGT